MPSKIIFILIACLSANAIAQPTHKCQPDNIPAATPTQRFVDNGDGSVSDTQTDLIWKKCVEGLSGSDCAQGEALFINWAQALLYLHGKEEAAQGWRLPNVRELSTIVETQCMYPSINQEVFPATPAAHVWTASPYHFYTHYSWYVDFAQGSPTYDERIRDKGLRLVRDK